MESELEQIQRFSNQRAAALDQAHKANAALTEQNTRLKAALEAVLLFHSGSYWDEQKRLEWQQLAQIVLGHCTDRSSHNMPIDQWEATTRVLCDMARAALGRPKR